MAKFIMFDTACFTSEAIQSKRQSEELGIEMPIELTYKKLPIRPDYIVYYFPLRSTSLGSVEDEVLLEEDEVWFDASFVNIVLIDGTELTVKMNIQDFEILINEAIK